tara:strand:+ start:2146 stop:3282 length:1137 start_codon:yes stop_codon:yes gene_type:complete
MKTSKFYNLLKQNKIDFFTGVPDSLLKSFIQYITKHENKNNHIISANEGSAIGIAIGYNLATQKIPLVYMQNSGLGNAVNPILSLADKKVYSIPMLLVIGWRGQPGIHDEPQHLAQGAVTKRILNSMNIPFLLVSKKTKPAEIKNFIKKIQKNVSPAALLLTKDALEEDVKLFSVKSKYKLSREEVIKKIVDSLSKNDVIVSTTGMASRELYEYLKSSKIKIANFLTVGGMGHASQISLGIAIKNKKRKVICLDGDGSLIMHLGSLSTIGTNSNLNLTHFILNNGVHGSVGDQPTAGFKIDFLKIADACGYDYIYRCENSIELQSVLKKISKQKGKIFIEIRLNTDFRSNLGRPESKPIGNKLEFIRYLTRKEKKRNI